MTIKQTFGDFEVNDVIYISVIARAVITDIKPSEIAEGMLRFEYRVQQCPESGYADIGTLVDSGHYQPLPYVKLRTLRR